jgi:hypothetical protein
MSDRRWPSEPDDRASDFGDAPTGGNGTALDGGLPSTPPREVLDALGVAQIVLGELAAAERHLSVHEWDGAPRVRVIEADGTVVQELSTARALELLSGEDPSRL